MKVPSLKDIPPEILCEILGFLDPKSLLLCSTACKLWHGMVKSSPELQYTIELWADGMTRGSSGVLTRAETLKALHDRRQAWRKLEWTSKTIVEIESLGLCRAYELVAGVFAQQQQGPDFVAISLSGIVDDPQKARAIHSVEIDLQSFRDLAIDPTQDLLVRFYTPTDELAYLECCTISSHEPHPLAARSILTFSLDRDPIGFFSIQIADDVIGIFFPESPFNFALFNWRAGLTITEAADDEDEPLLVTEFHLLSSRSYLFAHASFGTGREAGQIDIVTFDGDCTDSPTHVATLKLPELLPPTRVINMIIQAGPFCAKPISGTPFSKSNDKRIYMFLISYNSDSAPPKWCRLFVHYRWLHDYVLDHVCEKTGVTVVPWNEWGPRNSRMLLGENHQWNRHVHGERVAIPCENRWFVQILDFGIIPQRSTDLPSSTGFTAELHVEPTTVSLDGYVGNNTVTTSLPYMSTLRALDEECDLFLMDQDRIIAMAPTESTHQMTVYTF
ncbi:hypothetical protein K438DRAFT_1831422 [Mycena galopus ATCC 62051]|nr:hypothetical protein K438DRAFT_1831422 [Mycena galopus ATCC 62051]